MLYITGAGATACVLKVNQIADQPDHSIKVSICINIGKGGTIIGIEIIKAIKGVGTTRLLYITGASAAACILKVIKKRVSTIPHNSIEVSIPIYIGKGGGAISTHKAQISNHKAIKGIVSTCSLYIAGAGATACVLKVIQRAVIFANKSIEVSIPIYIGKGGSRPLAHINTIKGIISSGLLHITGIYN